jgi:hypothetical protein
MAAAWILATSATHLTVLRAHLLDRRRLRDLLDLRSRTGVRLTLVCHRGTVPAPMERALAPAGYRLAQACAVLPGVHDPSVSQLPPYRPLAGRWLPLSALTTLVAVDGRDRRCRCTAPAAQARGFHPPQMRASVAEEIAHRLHAATAHPHLAAELATAVFTAASTTQLATVHPGDLAPRGHHDHPPRPGPAAAGLPDPPGALLGPPLPAGRRLPAAHRRRTRRAAVHPALFGQRPARGHPLRRGLQTAPTSTAPVPPGRGNPREP